MYNSNMDNNLKPKHTKKNIAIAALLVIIIFSIIAYIIDVSYISPHSSSTELNSTIPLNVKLSSTIGLGSYHSFNLTRKAVITNITLINQLYNLNIPGGNVTKGIKVVYYGSNSLLELISVLNTSASKNYNVALNHEIATRSYSNVYNKTYDGLNYSEFYRTYNSNIKTFLILGYYKNYFAVIYSIGNYTTSSFTNYTIPSLVNIMSSQTT